MPVPRELTQPPGDRLISYDDFVLRLQKLEFSPRVRIEQLERSREGRQITDIIIAAEEVINNLDRYRTAADDLLRPRLRHTAVDDWETGGKAPTPSDMRYSAVIMGESFGHEASHVEALVEANDLPNQDRIIVGQQLIIP